MPKITKPLTDTEIKKAKPKDKQYKLSDGAGLSLIITPKGSKWFRFDYSYNKKRKSISFGTYPDCSLKSAREQREQAKIVLKDGFDPSLRRKLEKNIETFETVSKKWLEMMKDDWAEVTYKKAVETIEGNCRAIRDRDMKTIKRVDILEILETMAHRGAHVLARRLLGYLERIWKYAATYEIVEHNIMADIDKKNALKQVEKKHFPAITKEEDIKVLMNDIREYKNYKQADISAVAAFLLSPYIALRPFNLRCLEWNEINLEKKIIEIPGSKMKTSKDFIIPMSKQILKILETIKPYSSNISNYVFPSPSGSKSPISENTLNMALKRMGYKGIMTPHGFRAMFSTILHEKRATHGFDSHIIEACLAHVEQNKVKAAYDREDKMKYFEERRELMQWWADWLDSL